MDRYEMVARIIALLEAPLAAEGYALLDVRTFLGGGRVTIRIFVDTEDGIDVDGCARASRSASYLLEEADLIPEAYVVEVSSPGVRRPLRTRAHYEAAIGQDVVLKTVSGARTKTVKGRLLEIRESGLLLSPGDEGDPPQEVQMAKIREASLDPEFDVQALINADRRQRKEEKRLLREERRKSK